MSQTRKVCVHRRLYAEAQDSKLQPAMSGPRDTSSDMHTQKVPVYIRARLGVSGSEDGDCLKGNSGPENCVALPDSSGVSRRVRRKL